MKTIYFIEIDGEYKDSIITGYYSSFEKAYDALVYGDEEHGWIYEIELDSKDAHPDLIYHK